MAQRSWKLTPGWSVVVLGLLAVVVGAQVGRLNHPTTFTDQQRGMAMMAGVLGLCGLWMLSSALELQGLASRRTAKAAGTVRALELETSYDDGSSVHRWAVVVLFWVGKVEGRAKFHPSGAFTNMSSILNRVERKFPVGLPLTVRYDPKDLGNATVGRALSTYAAVVILLPLASASLFACAYYFGATTL